MSPKRAVLPWPTAPVSWHPGALGYPAPLMDLAQPPAPLRVLGELPAIGPAAVAIVGTRHPSAGALDFAHGLAHDLARHGLTIVSGGAEGIDAAAHRGALDGGGPTVVVLANGLRHPYPRQHGPLFVEVLAAGGALVSEGLDHWSPRPGLFLRRNRVIAALANATVVVQAPERSGALSTARWAISLKRRVFGVPGSPWDVRSSGTLTLLRNGGEICTSARDVLSVRPLSRREATLGGTVQGQSPYNFSHLSDEVKDLFRCLQPEPAHPDRIARELDRPTERVQELLLTLELGGLVRRRTDGRYCLVNGGLADG